MTADLRTRSLPYLRDGKVTVVTAEDRPSGRLIQANVAGHMSIHIVDGWIPSDGIGVQRWRCTCARHLEDTCPHREAVKLVTGGSTEIRPKVEDDKHG